MPDQADRLPPPSLFQRLTPYAAWGIPVIVAFLIGWPLGGLYGAAIGTSLFLILIWTGAYFAWGFRFVRETEFYVVERWGRFYKVMVKGNGFLVYPGIIDQIKLHDSFAAKEIDLYTDEDHNEIDFQDASAPIDASAWYHIANPDDVFGHKWQKVRAEVYTYTYSVYEGARDERIAQLFEGALTPILQKKEIGQAQENGAEDGKQAADAARAGLVNIGVYPRREQPIIIHDIEVPEEVIKLRELKLQGQMEAEETRRQSHGYSGAIKGIAEDLEELAAKNPAHLAMAKEIFEYQRGLDIVKVTGANVTYIAPGVVGMVGAFNVGKKE